MRLPPLNALRAFEAAARHQSFLAAANELNVTPAAISQQIKGLEADLGVQLFERRARGVAITGAGRELLPELTKGFGHLARAVGGLSGGDLAGRLTISAAKSFATLWLVPRLGSFLEQFPEIDVRIVAQDRPLDLATGEADIRIPYGLGDYPGLSVAPLMVDTIFPVAAPGLLNRKPIRSFSDLKLHVLLADVEVDKSEPTMTWARWLRDHGVQTSSRQRFVEFSDSILLTQSAVLGHGVALGRLALVREHLQAGRLVRPLKIARPSDYAYFTVTTEAGRTKPRVRAFVAWLERQVASEAEDRLD